MVGSAANWLETLGENVWGDIHALQRAFNERYQAPDIVKYKTSKEIFNRRQQEGENIDDYTVSMRKLSKVIEADDKLTRYAILNGLRPALASYVTQQKPDTMEALLEAARIAEITCTPANTADSQLTEQMASMQCQLQRLVSRFDRCSTSPVAADRRSGSPRPKVTFGRTASIPIGAYEENPTAGPARTSALRGQFRTGRRPNSAVLADRKHNRQSDFKFVAAVATNSTQRARPVRQ